MEGSKHHLRQPIYLGATISALMALLPYVNQLFLPAFVLGPLAGVWFEVRWKAQRVSFTEGAQIGFLSAFYGTMAASAIYDIGWKFFHEQLWRVQNSYRLLPLLAGKGQDTATPFEWYFFMIQLTVVAIIAGAISAPLGILGVKFFQRDS